jgi:hypothetical protein
MAIEPYLSLITAVVFGGLVYLILIRKSSPRVDDPIAEADVYLAYGRKNQAIEILEASLKQNPEQPEVVTKLKTLQGR